MSQSPNPVPQRIGDAERDRATESLRDHLTQGRLTQEEFDERVGQALTARTYADLDPLFADLPGGRPGAGQTPATAYAAPPWQTAGMSDPAPNSSIAPLAASSVPARSSFDKTMMVVSAIIWPVTLIAIFATSWDYWWLIFIPIMFSSVTGGAYAKNGRDRSRHHPH